MKASHVGNTETGSGYPLNDAPVYGTPATDAFTTVAPLSNIPNEENASLSVVGASSSGIGATPTGLRLTNIPGQAGPSNFATNQAYLPSQIDHGVSASVSPHNSSVKPPEPAFNGQVAAHGSSIASSAYPAFAASNNAIHHPPIDIDHGNGAIHYYQ